MCALLGEGHAIRLLTVAPQIHPLSDGAAAWQADGLAMSLVTPQDLMKSLQHPAMGYLRDEEDTDHLGPARLPRHRREHCEGRRACGAEGCCTYASR